MKKWFVFFVFLISGVASAQTPVRNDSVSTVEDDSTMFVVYKECFSPEINMMRVLYAMTKCLPDEVGRAFFDGDARCMVSFKWNYSSGIIHTMKIYHENDFKEEKLECLRELVGNPSFTLFLDYDYEEYSLRTRGGLYDHHFMSIFIHSFFGSYKSLLGYKLNRLFTRWE